MKTFSFRNLGITIDSTLSFTPHISDVISRALKMTGFVKRCTRDFTNVSAIRLLYCSLIRPILEYGSSVCISHTQIVGVQRRKTIITTMMNYTKDFLWHHSKTEENRKFLKISLKSDCPELLSLINLAVPLRCTRTQCLFHQPFCRTNVGLNSYINRTTKLANYLSPALNFSTNEKSFVRFIKDCYI